MVGVVVQSATTPTQHLFFEDDLRAPCLIFGILRQSKTPLSAKEPDSLAVTRNAPSCGRVPGYIELPEKL